MHAGSGIVKGAMGLARIDAKDKGGLAEIVGEQAGYRLAQQDKAVGDFAKGRESSRTGEFLSDES
jgi:hypothetical protein